MSLHVAVMGTGAAARELVETLQCLGEAVRLIQVAEDTADLGSDPAPAGVQVMGLDQMIALGEAVDIVFDLGDSNLRRRLRQALFASDNRHTVIAPAAVARLVGLLAGKPALSLTGGGY